MVYSVFAISLVIVMRVDPSDDAGWLFDSWVILGCVGLFFLAFGKLYASMERRLSARTLSLTMLLAASVLGALVTLLAHWMVLRSLERPLPNFTALLAEGSLNGLLLLGLYVFTIRQPALLEELRTVRIEAELEALRARFEPHFLLNTLNAIAGLLKEHPQKARQALSALGDLLEDALAHEPAREHFVSDEVAWLRSYLVLLEARYADALMVVWHVDPLAEARRIPRLLVQPLVENAALHCMATSAFGQLDITFKVASDDELLVRIFNSGPAPDPDTLEEGNGLLVVRRRLALEAPRATFSLSPGVGGAVAELRFPRE